jgi:hypothetical protein
MRYFEIVANFNSTKEQIIELEKSYEGKLKGEVYLKRKQQLITKLGDLKNRALGIGVWGKGNIAEVRGKRKRQHRKNPKLWVTENFKIYFIDVTEEEVSNLVKLHVNNIETMTITFIKPGKIII